MTDGSPFAGFYSRRRVFLTGHTGFKGGWLALWLSRLGAEVHGYSLDPPTSPSLFDSAQVSSALAADTRGDLSDLPLLKRSLAAADPEIVFHLAAQPIVLSSYLDPLQTLTTNILGTANLLEAARNGRWIRAVVLITTDKVYKEGDGMHRENDLLGGYDPYSASKAAAEIVADSYRSSFFGGKHSAKIATARSGNVLGGGDWACDRLIPNCIRAFIKKESVLVRPAWAIRPWQHVLEPLSGYIELGRRLCTLDGSRYAKAWNFGPDGTATVEEVAETAARLWGDDTYIAYPMLAEYQHERGTLRLDSTLARTELGWKPRWNLEQALEKTVGWYKAWYRGVGDRSAGGRAEDMRAVSLEQIGDYEAGEAGDEKAGDL